MAKRTNSDFARKLRFFFFFQAEDGIRDLYVTGVQTCALPISRTKDRPRGPPRTDADARPRQNSEAFRLASQKRRAGRLYREGSPYETTETVWSSAGEW